MAGGATPLHDRAGPVGPGTGSDTQGEDNRGCARLLHSSYTDLCAAHLHYDLGVHCVSDDEGGEALAFCSTTYALHSMPYSSALNPKP
jgi:hypothetical protein